MRTYELMTIHRPDITEDDVKTHLAEVESFLKTRGASVSETDLWGKRRFAYEIEHLNEGFYTVLTFDSQGEVIDDLERMLTLSDPVLRHKVVKLAGANEIVSHPSSTTESHVPEEEA